MSATRPTPVFAGLRRLMSTAAAAKEAVGIYQKLVTLRITGGGVSGTLDGYIGEGKWLSKSQLIKIVKDLRLYGRHTHSLEVMAWMVNRNVKFSTRDHGIFMDVVYKVKGIAAAENYFTTLPAYAKNKFTYNALLCCYSMEAVEDKALLLFNRMKMFGFLTHVLPYINLMTLYMRIGKPEKIPGLVEEMKLKNISLDSMTYNIWMQCYSSLDDIAGVEKVFEEMSEKDAALCDWRTFSNLAAIYVRAGLHEKAESALRKLELVMDSHHPESYHHLMTIYASLSNLAEVHRVWGSLKATLQVTTNASHLVMLQCLRRLRDLEGLRNVFEEWQSNCSSYDIRLAKVVISAYLDRDMVEEAEAVFRYASTKAFKPFVSATELFMVYFLKRDCLERCMEFLKVAVSLSKNQEWIPGVVAVDTFLMHFEGNGDIKAAEELFSVMKDVSSLKGAAYNLLLKAYAAAGKTEPKMRRMLGVDGVEISNYLEKLLQKVCPS